MTINVPTQTRGQRVSFVSLGCAKNLVDSEVMIGKLGAAGWELVPDANDADAIVVNTCAFIDPAKAESTDVILEHAQRKRPGQQLIVAGCLSQRFGAELQSLIPEIDGVVGTGAYAGIVELLEDAKAGKKPVRLDFEAEPEHDFLPRLITTPSATAYLKIAEGCDHPCSFCIIPQLRGQFRSRRFESVIAEAEKLAQSGVREITLIGQDTTCYGEDLGLKDGLAVLLEKLAGVDGLRWVRFLYAYPNKITKRLLETIAAHDNICSYMDVPLQHASPTVLKRMKRGGGSDVFLRSIEKMRRIIPGVTLRTSFIVGFPGETEKEFEELCDFVKEAELDWMGAFGYSDQEGAGAFDQDKKLSAREIESRRKSLMSIQKRISRAKKKTLIGQEFDLLLEGASTESDLLLEGRTAMHAPEIDGKVFVNDYPEGSEPKEGEFYRCRITAAHDYDLVAEIV